MDFYFFKQISERVFQVLQKISMEIDEIVLSLQIHMRKIDIVTMLSQPVHLFKPSCMFLMEF